MQIKDTTQIFSRKILSLKRWRLSLNNNTMKKLYIVIFVLSISILSISNIYLWKDNAQQWNIMNTQIKMFERLFYLLDKNRIYEDEILEESYSNNIDI